MSREPFKVSDCLPYFSLVVGLGYLGHVLFSPKPQTPDKAIVQTQQAPNWSQFESWAIGKTYKEIEAQYGPTWTNNLDNAGGAQWVHRYKDKGGELRYTHYWVNWKGAFLDGDERDKTTGKVTQQYFNLNTAVGISVISEDHEGNP